MGQTVSYTNPRWGRSPQEGRSDSIPPFASRRARLSLLAGDSARLAGPGARELLPWVLALPFPLEVILVEERRPKVIEMEGREFPRAKSSRLVPVWECVISEGEELTTLDHRKVTLKVPIVIEVQNDWLEGVD